MLLYLLGKLQQREDKTYIWAMLLVDFGLLWSTNALVYLFEKICAVCETEAFTVVCVSFQYFRLMLDVVLSRSLSICAFMKEWMRMNGYRKKGQGKGTAGRGV